MRRLAVKRLEDGRAMLNLACGARCPRAWNNVDFSPLVRLARHTRLARAFHALHLVSDPRYERLGRTDPDVICWDLRRGIPFEDGTFDVVYHSHFLEHLERNAARRLLDECRRVLRHAGILRLVVPDLETLCRDYLESCRRLGQMAEGPQTRNFAFGDPNEASGRRPEAGGVAKREKTPLGSPGVYGLQPTAYSLSSHEPHVHDLIAQMVPSQCAGTRAQPWPLRTIERWFRGDSLAAGEAHRWMYDRFTLGALLQSAGYSDIRVEAPGTSRIAGWPAFGLDTNADGSPYKRHSLYMEATK
jgi:SAM-dependent methyltransferase